jgi:hypothetical protein
LFLIGIRILSLIIGAPPTIIVMAALFVGITTAVTAGIVLAVLILLRVITLSIVSTRITSLSTTTATG